MGLDKPTGQAEGEDLDPTTASPTLDQVRDEDSAYRLLEDLRWGDRPVCPHCGSARQPYFLKPRHGGRATRTGRLTRRRVWKCAVCRKQFSALTGTVLQGTKIPIRTWIRVVREMAASSQGVSARDIERKYGLTAKTAWSMVYRIRDAMRREPMASMLGGTTRARGSTPAGPSRQRDSLVFEHRRRSGGTETMPVSRQLGQALGDVGPRPSPGRIAALPRGVARSRIDVWATMR